MTRTDRILAAITSELEQRRNEIDRDSGLRSVAVRVKLSDKSGQPFRVIYEPLSEHDLP